MYHLYTEDDKKSAIKEAIRRTTIDEMDDNMFEIYMKYNLCICERADMIGATSHMLDIFRKI